MNIDFFLRYLLIAGIIIGLWVWIYAYYKNPSKRNYTISPILFSAHALLFSIIAGFNLIPKDVYLIWGDLVSIHGIVILISTGIVLIQYLGGKKYG